MVLAVDITAVAADTDHRVHAPIARVCRNPVLLVLGVAPTAVAASPLIQLPLVGSAVLGYPTTGSVHYGLGTPARRPRTAGVLGGALATHRLRQHTLRWVATAILISVGICVLGLPFLPGLPIVIGRVCLQWTQSSY